MTSFLEQLDARLAEMQAQREALGSDGASIVRSQQIARDMRELLETCGELSPSDKVFLARNPARPGVRDFIKVLFTDFFEQKGDRLFRQDPSIYGGIALYHGKPVTVIGHCKGKNLEENLRCNFGMPSPEGYRKALRLMRAAEKFKRPVITFIDTPGAYPGIAAEENGQGAAIAECLAFMSALTVPVIAIVTGEGGSGGALALGVANTVLMLENAVYSVLSPEGFASILWKNPARAQEACGVMKLTAQELERLEVIDGIIKEPTGGAHHDVRMTTLAVDEALAAHLEALTDVPDLAAHRFAKYRKMGTQFLSVSGKEIL